MPKPNPNRNSNPNPMPDLRYGGPSLWRAGTTYITEARACSHCWRRPSKVWRIYW